MENIDILRKQIAFHKAGIEAGAKMSETQNDWLKSAEKRIFWDQAVFDEATLVLGRTPTSQDEAVRVNSAYTRNQIALSR